VAGVALGYSDLHFAWQAWHLCHWAGYSGALGSFGRSDYLHGRRGTWRQQSSLCMAGMALGDIDLHFAWQAWYLAISVFTLRGWCVVGDSDLHFAWHARHLATATFTLRGRCSTYGSVLALVTR